MTSLPLLGCPDGGVASGVGCKRRSERLRHRSAMQALDSECLGPALPFRQARARLFESLLLFRCRLQREGVLDPFLRNLRAPKFGRCTYYLHCCTVGSVRMPCGRTVRSSLWSTIELAASEDRHTLICRCNRGRPIDRTMNGGHEQHTRDDYYSKKDKGQR